MIRKCIQLSAVALVALLIPPMLARAGFTAPVMLSSTMTGMVSAGNGVADSLSVSAGIISESTAALAQQMVNANASAERALEIFYAYLIPDSPSEKLAGLLVNEISVFEYAGTAIASQTTDGVLMGADAVKSFYAYLNTVLPGRNFPDLVIVRDTVNGGCGYHRAGGAMGQESRKSRISGFLFLPGDLFWNNIGI
ncbi:MAG: hypothetical protein AAB375_03610 [Patescibacteria group bacterium]